jgi:regulatory protein
MKSYQSFKKAAKKSSEPIKALDCALYFLGHRKRSEKEIITKLKQKDYEEAEIEETLVKLRELGFIDDADFAQSLINDRRNFNKVGKRMLVQELRAKGINGEIIDEMVSLNATDESEFDNALALAEKKAAALAGQDSQAIKHKLYQFLLRKGYSSHSIARVLRHLALGGNEE